MIIITMAAAGIVPYVKINGKIFFLLGLENGMWSGFVGNSKLDELPVDTAIREFNEETAMIFNNLFQYIYSKLLSTYPVIDKSSTGKKVHVWFIKFPKEVFDTLVNERFKKNKIYYSNIPDYQEKNNLYWFNELPFNTFNKLKNMLAFKKFT